ncbi:MAG: hypothetical protein JNJ63_11145 [Hyphomonadaceae bacterium]|nr:hypothetical protein [Hyphomonadaceae bacterium]
MIEPQTDWIASLRPRERAGRFDRIEDLLGEPGEDSESAGEDARVQPGPQR